jgi:hypothetical protein
MSVGANAARHAIQSGRTSTATVVSAVATATEP